MLTVYRSVDVDVLADRLADTLADVGGLDPFASEPVVVQSAGMRRWLSHRLSERLGAAGARDGICAKVDFLFPGQLVRQILQACDVGGDEQVWRPERLAWAVAAVLPDLAVTEDVGSLSTYLDDEEAVDRRTYALSRRVADLLDRYSIHRPDMVAAWMEGEDLGGDGERLAATQRWQPVLWRRLTDGLEGASPRRRISEGISRLRDDEPAPGPLPPRVSLFGIGALAGLHLELLSAAARHTEVSLYVPSPSPALWNRVSELAESTPAAEIDVHHPLLVSCGRLARDFQWTLESLDDGYHDTVVAAGERRSTSTLSTVQDDLRHDRERGAPSADAADPARPDPVALPDDTTVQLHACHSPGRQVEVLHDVLLDLFDRNPDLQPRDVLVMTPDIATYAPLITSTFGRDRDGAAGGVPHIPVEVADRTVRRTNPVAEVLLELLALVDSRMESSRVLDLLALEPVRRRFGLGEPDLGTIRGWTTDTGIRWGVDADHRAAHGQPADRAHTWRFGLDRLLAGVTMADEHDRVLGDVTPYDDMEGDTVELLSRFVAFCEELFATVDDLREPRPLAGWVDALGGALDRLTELDEDRGWLDQRVREQISEVHRAGGDTDVTVTLTGIRTVLGERLEDVPGRAGYETGRATFCSLVPMRSVPHRVVCLLGMDAEVFPRGSRPLGFDLMAAAPRTGDRTPRDEDRQLFLEAVLSARDHLVVTYTGRDVRTNQPTAPAVPVGELLDVLDRSFTVDDPDRSARDELLTEHPLQPFSPRNFGVDDAGAPRQPLSFDRTQLAAAKGMRSTDPQRLDFFPEDHPLPDDEEQDDTVVELGDLLAFYDNPTRWLLNRRLGLWLREHREHLDDVDPVEADALGSWRIGNALLHAQLQGRDHPEWTRAMLARGDVPQGTLGTYEIGKVAARVDEITRIYAEHAADEPEDLPVDVEVAGRRLMGVVTEVHDDLVLRVQYTTPKPKHRLTQWIRQLALTATHPERPIASLLAARERDDVSTFHIAPLAGGPTERRDHARAVLDVLLDHHARGRRRPLALFPRASAAYAAAIHDGKSPQQALKKAKSGWQPNWQGWGGDVGDEHIAHVYGDLDFAEVVDGTDFAAVSLAVWEPLLDAEEQG